MSHKKAFKLLCLFDFKCSTGFATVSKNIIRRLRKHFGKRMLLDIIAINYITKDGDGNAVPGKAYITEDQLMSVHPALNLERPFEQQDLLGRHEFLFFLQNSEYDGVFIIQDPGVMAGRKEPDGCVYGSVIEQMKKIKADKKAKNKKQFKSIFYFPVDGTPLPEWFDDLDFFDLPVAYTEYAKEEVLKLRPELKSKIKTILHGADLKDFNPLGDVEKSEFRKAYFGEHADKTIFCNINRNQTRKDIPSTIFAFEHYKQNYNPNSFLYLHMQEIDPDPQKPQGWNLYNVLRQTFLIEGVDYAFPSEEANAIDPSYLNCIYNACDFYMTTTTGEGFGLSILEAMACKVPVIAPFNTSIMEISDDGDRCWVARTLHKHVSNWDNMIRSQVNYKEFAILMDIAQRHPEKSKERVELAYSYAKSLSWDNVCQRWIDEFEKLF